MFLMGSVSQAVYIEITKLCICKTEL